MWDAANIFRIWKGGASHLCILHIAEASYCTNTQKKEPSTKNEKRWLGGKPTNCKNGNRFLMELLNCKRRSLHLFSPVGGPPLFRAKLLDSVSSNIFVSLHRHHQHHRYFLKKLPLVSSRLQGVSQLRVIARADLLQITFPNFTQ